MDGKLTLDCPSGARVVSKILRPEFGKLVPLSLTLALSRWERENTLGAPGEGWRRNSLSQRERAGARENLSNGPCGYDST